MFYLGIKSGLGNQMFQYAYGYTAAKKAGIPLSLDISAYDRQFAKDTPRNFTLQNYNISAPIAPIEETVKFHTPLRIFLRRIKNKIKPAINHLFDAREFDIKDGQYKEGYWQSAKYFESYADDIRKEFTLKNAFGSEAVEALREIEACKDQGITTILVHVRRGDFITNAHSVASLGILPAEYFINAIKLIQERLILASTEKPIHIFFASEDPAWVEGHIKTEGISSSFITRPGIKDFEELLVMSHCDHFVISNSSFSWWSAWLATNPHKIVVAPKRWMVDPKIRTDDATPPNWLRI
jgi:hypothetical protein